MAGRQGAVSRLYSTASKAPTPNFNGMVLKWLRDELVIRDHAVAKAFAPVRALMDLELTALASDRSTKAAHTFLLSNLTRLLLEIDLGAHLEGRLVGDLINLTGFRSALSQGHAKNNGENFVNAIVYGLAKLLESQDRILVDKGTPPCLKDALCLTRNIELAGHAEVLKIPIECDFAIYDREDPSNAIVVSAKTRLKEVFHVGTMWKILFDMVGDEYCEQKWGLKSNGDTSQMIYCFATADMIPPKGSRTQGGDVERASPRNLIKMDASFFDYVFVSKADIPHVASTLDLARGREALFHELGCLVSLIEQKFRITIS
ncbi:MAG TPA: hypothetical protein VM621_12590 [Luteibacter sp.]|uniref:hypothetical protein n=1 Tax=Luteibacter sp. TaxID=1886636 RepID=UPI002CA9211E|nr:hypothetical protein [Luteibacter sp.]HVI55873.1 hypothetical protein [Luteibacter sp.]